MDRKYFLKKSALGLGTLFTIPIIGKVGELNSSDAKICEVTPDEIAGPFPIKSPLDLVRENIIGNKSGIPLLIKFIILDASQNCQPIKNVDVDLWHCDARGNYSEYNRQVDGDFTEEHFLRGRQSTDEQGSCSFLSIYPGWYPGRAPHLHVEVKTNKGKSLLITQIAFPEDISKSIYQTKAYLGKYDTSNKRDYEFRDSLDGNIVDEISGDLEKGYTMIKTIKI